MGFNLVSYPQIIIKQAAAPVITTSSLLWRDTDDDVLYFSDGTAWQAFSSASTSAGFESMVSELALEILRLSAEGVLTAPDYNGMFIDYFSSAGGVDSTINTGSTTATWESTGQYVNNLLTPEVVGITIATNPADVADYRGVKIHTNSACLLTSVKVAATTTATKIYLYSSAPALLDTQTLSSLEATFNYQLTDNTDYYIVAGADGGSYNFLNNSAGLGLPDNHTNFNITAGTHSTSTEDTTLRAISEITTKTAAAPSDLIIKTNVQALGFAPAYILIHAKDKTTAGTGAINFDVSFDNGATEDSTANALDTKISVVDGSGKNMIITLNLDGTGSGNTASLKDYEVILWSS